MNDEKELMDAIKKNTELMEECKQILRDIEKYMNALNKK